MKTQFAIIALLAAAAGGTHGTAQESPCFEGIVNDAGWDVPKLGERLRTSTATPFGASSGVKRTVYRCVEDVWIACHTVRAERLLLNSFLFWCSEASVYERGGRVFAYAAEMRGREVGVSMSAWWIDRDGDGVFEEFLRSPSDVSVPDWVPAPSKNTE